MTLIRVSKIRDVTRVKLDYGIRSGPGRELVKVKSLSGIGRVRRVKPG
jgi:hypothetical protein